MHFSKHVLKNGLRVVLVPMKETQTVTTMILVEAGSKYETKENNGISHFLEHMMFKGTEKRPSSKIITEELDSVGGDYNAFTSKEQTGYWIKVPKKHFDLALDVVSDMYLNPLLDQKEIDKERGVILQEMSMYKDLPTRYVWDVFEELLYGDQPAGWDIIGTEENIKKFMKDDFVSYLSGFYVPASTVVVIAGNFDEKYALSEVEKRFNSFEEVDKQEKLKTIEKQSGVQIRPYIKKTDQTHLIVGVRSCDMFSDDRFAAVLMGTILGGGMSSRAFHNIREKHGLTYYIDAGAEQSTDTGFFFVRAGVEHKNVDFTVELILKEFKDFTTSLVSEKELAKAKEYIKGKTLMSLESSSEVAPFFGDQELFKNELKKPTELFKEIDAVTAEDIRRFAEKIFVNDGLNLAYIGPEDPSDKLKSSFRL